MRQGPEMTGGQANSIWEGLRGKETRNRIYVGEWDRILLITFPV